MYRRILTGTFTSFCSSKNKSKVKKQVLGGEMFFTCPLGQTATLGINYDPYAPEDSDEAKCSKPRLAVFGNDDLAPILEIKFGKPFRNTLEGQETVFIKEHKGYSFKEKEGENEKLVPMSQFKRVADAAEELFGGRIVRV